MSGRGMSRQRGQGGFATGLFAVTLMFLAAAAALVWVSMGIVTSERWPIRWLEINGAFQRVSAEQLRANLSSGVGSSFFTVDLQALGDAATRISWVSTARVQKQWPDTVRVSVEEYVPVAHWNRGQLVADSGTPFAVPEADEIQGLPWLEGPEDRLPEVLRTWVGLDELLTPVGLEIAGIKLDSRGAWSLVLDNGTRVQLGRDSTVERLERLLASWAPLMLEKESPPQAVDLRYTNGFAVAWPQASAAAGDKM
ncbi:MAG TPA: cell division protein FtsQ/DivIB [Xanthomonadales bacterium]|nr:cell division protein FtsQ/DivIB [Xanthomonadales bacterium]